MDTSRMFEFPVKEFFKHYEALCDRVEVVRTIDQLAGIAEELVKARA